MSKTSRPKITLKAKKADTKLKDIRKLDNVADTKDNLNENLTSVLNALVLQIRDENRKLTDRKAKTANNFRLKQINSAIDTLANHPEKIESGKDAIKLKGIGKGIGQRIDTILETGTLPDELKVDQEVDEEAEAIKNLSTVTGIGEAHALSFYRKYGVKTVAELKDKFSKGEIKKEKNALTHHMVIGLMYYDDFNVRIPHDEITHSKAVLDAMMAHFKKTVPGIKYEICGSYRRQRDTSGDMDVLITSPKYNTYDELHAPKVRVLSQMVDWLIDEGFLIDHLTQDITTKYMGVCRIEPDGPARRIDIRMVAHESWPSAMLYFTGSGTFNIRMRNVALSLGYTLNEYGLYPLNDGKKGAVIPVGSEKDIFEKLGLMYITPKERL
jgi:DNA polymerase/3'-5' exonuclease PolX